MDLTLIFIGIVPLFVFVVVDSFMGLKSALISAVIFALLELILSLYFFGGIDWVTVLSVGLVLILSFFSWRLKSDLHFKLQPVIFSGILGFFFLISFWCGYPLLSLFVAKYLPTLPLEMQVHLRNPSVAQLMVIMSHYLGYAFFAHGALTAWSAFKWSNWWWIAIRGFGFYFFQILALIAARITLGI